MATAPPVPPRACATDAAAAGVSVGCDRVRREGDRVLIETARAEPRWIPSRHRPVIVHLDDDTPLVLRSATPMDGGRWCYEWTPRVVADGDRPALELRYDADYVAERERTLRWQGRGALASALAMPLFPLFGLLPSGVKARLQDRIGLDAAGATRASLSLERIALGVLAVWMVLHWLTATPLTASLDGGGWLLAVGAADWMLRTQSLAHPERPPPGLLEWLWPGSWRWRD